MSVHSKFLNATIGSGKRESNYFHKFIFSFAKTDTSMHDVMQHTDKNLRPLDKALYSPSAMPRVESITYKQALLGNDR